MLYYSSDEKYSWERKTIGRGAHGVVFKGKRVEDGTTVAVKVKAN